MKSLTRKHSRPVSRVPGTRPTRLMVLALIAVLAAFGTYTIVQAAPNFVPTIVATMTDAFIGGDGDGKADPGETIEYTVSIPNTGTDATGVAFNNTIDANTTLSGSVYASPVASNDTYPEIIVGNVPINSALISYSVVSNDYLGQNPTATITAFDATSAQGGQVSMTLSGPGIGQFTYDPPTGYEGADTFTYTLTDNPNAASAASNRTATVTINISGMVWFVNNGATNCTVNGCGRLSHPFSTLAAFNSVNDGVNGPFSNHPASGDAIFVYESATAYTGGLTLLSNQKLIGQDATTSLAAITGLTLTPSSSMAFPAMNTGGNSTTIQNGSGNAITLNSGNTIRGLSISGTSGAGLIGTGVTTLTVGSDVSLSGITGNDLDLSGAASGAIDFGASITNTSGRAVSIQNRSGGAVNFTGAISDSGGTGVYLNSNTGATFTFSGGVSLSTGANAAFTATGGGTVNVCDESACNPAATGVLVNSLTTTTATALNVNATSIGANNLEFRSISSNGGSATGIILVNTGASGSLVVKGDGGSARGGNSSGGTITNKTGGTDGNGSTASAVYINSGSAILRNMTMTRLDNYGVYGLSVNNVTVQYSTIGAISGAACADADGDIGSTSGSGDAALVFGISNPSGSNGLANGGSLLLDNLRVYCSIEHQVEIYQQSNTFSATISNSDIKDASTSLGGDGIQTEMQGTANGTITVDNVSFDDNKSQAVQAAANDTSTLDMTVRNSTLVRSSQGNEGIVMSNGSSGRLTAHITGNNISGVPGANIFVGQTPGNATAASSLTAYIGNNNITHPTTATNSAVLVWLTSTAGAGAPANVMVTNNTINENSTSGVSRGIFVDTPDAGTNPNFSVTVLSNTVHVTDSITGLQGIVVQGRQSSTACYDVRSNFVDFPSGIPSGINGIRIRQANTATVNLEQGSSAGAAAAVLAANNTPSTADAVGTVAVVGNSTCLTPPVAALPSSQTVASTLPAEDAAATVAAPTSTDTLAAATVRVERGKADMASDTGSGKPLFIVNPKPLQSGETVSVTIGNLPAGKTAIIKYRVTVNSPSLPLGTTKIVNQGTVSGGNFSNVLTTNGGTVDCETGSETCTPVDRPDTTVVSLTRQSGNPTKNATVTWQVVFADAVDSLTASNFSLAQAGGVSGASITSVTETSGPPSTTWNITANTGSGNGTLGLNFANDTGLTHDVTNAVFTGQVYTIDRTPPTVTVEQAGGQLDPTGSSPIHFTVVFNEPVTGFADGDVTLGGTANPTTDTVSEIAPNDGTTYDVAVSGMSADGTVTASIGVNKAQDAAGNGNDASTSGDNSVTYTRPTDLSITKTDGAATATPGGNVTYTITASNAGPFADPAAIVADTLPASLSGATWTCVGAGGGTCTAAGSGNINDTVNLPVGGSVTYTVSAAISASATGTLVNTATVTSSLSDPALGNNSATDSDTLNPQADLAITKTDGATSVSPGGSVTYTITASNAGPSNAPSSTVADTLPASLNGVTWTCVGAGGGTCTAAGSGNISDTVNLPAGGSVTFTVTATLNSGASGTLSNTATVAAAGGITDPNSGNNSATDTDTITPSADLSITKTDGATTATPGGNVTYTITASNAGPLADPTATVADTLPASLSGVTWTCVGAGGGTCTASGSGNINDTVNLPVGGSVTFTVTGTISPSATGSLSNTATVTSSISDLTPGNNSATDTDTLTPTSDLSITKTDGVTTATPGGSVTYTITASNAGPSNAPSTTVADTLPAVLTANWTCVGAGGGTCTASGSGNINDTVNLPAGGSVTYTVSATISAAATGTLSNTATVTSSVTDPDPANNSATDTDTFTPQADLSITKTDGVTVAIPGGNVTYTITASNAGPSNAPGSTVADTFPASLTATWTCVGAGGGTCTAAGAGNINDTVNLPSGGSVTYTVSATVSISATGTLSNTATVAAPGGVTDPAPGNNSATDTDTIVPPVSVTIDQAIGQVDPTNAATINFTVVFGSAVTDFNDPSDVTLSGTANATTINITGGPTTYNVAVSGMTSDGTVIATIPLGVAAGSQGEPNDTSTSTDNTVTYDGTQPDTIIDSNPAALTNNTSASFTFHGTDAGSGPASYECKLDSGSFTACTSPQNYTSLAEGSHTFLVRTIDAVGNVDPTPANFNWVVDTTTPDTIIDSNPAVLTNSTSASFTFHGTDAGSGPASYECKLDSGSFTACTSPQTYTGLADGSHTFEVRTIDGIGNVDPTPALHTWTIDTAPLTVTLEQAAGQADPTKVSPVNFVVVFNKPVADFATGDVTLNGTANPTTGTVSEILPNNGTTYNVAVSGMTTGGTVIASLNAGIAHDAAGNSNSATLSTDNTIHFTFDTTTTITSDTPDPSLIGETVTFSYTVTVNSGSGTPTGNVTVSDGTNSCTDTVAAGSCTITFNSLGTKTLTATYEGDVNFNTSTSASVSHQVVNATTTTTITDDSPDPSTAGDPVSVKFSVDVNAPGSGTPTGNVTVTDGVDSCVGTVASGSCSITLTTPGIRTLTATYEGDTNFGGSTSADENHTVQATPAITSANAITFSVGVNGSFTVVTTGYPIPSLSETGTLPNGVTFVDNGDGTATLSGIPAVGTSGVYPLTFTAANGTTDATQNFTLTISVDPIFADVPDSYWASRYINAIYYAGLTGGCDTNPLIYCPEAPVTRAQMAVFIKRAIHGSTYQPPLPASFHFTDTIGHWAQNWIEDMYNEGITAGCGADSYCPEQNITRAQMAVFLLKAKNGTSYTPPTATGSVFNDVPADHWAAAWIEELAAEGISAGCGSNNYCPNAPITRAEMAVLIVTAMGLPLP